MASYKAPTLSDSIDDFPASYTMHYTIFGSGASCAKLIKQFGVKLT